MDAGKMVDWDFGDLAALPAGIDGDESVHFSVQLYALDDVLPVGLQRASVVVQVNTGNRRDKPVCYLRRKDSRQRSILPMVAPPRHDIVTLRKLVHDPRNIRGIVLQIPVERNNDVSLRVIDSCHHCGGLAEIAVETDHLVSWIACRNRLEVRFRRIRAAVVHEDDLEVDGRLLQRGAQALVQREDIFFLVVDWNDYCELHRD